MSTIRLSMPSPEQADIRCSTVLTFGAPGSPPGDNAVASRVSQTAVALTGISTTCGRSTRRNTMPLSTGAGFSVSSTRWPLCTPTPIARVRDFRVRWASIVPAFPWLRRGRIAASSRAVVPPSGRVSSASAALRVRPGCRPRAAACRRGCAACAESAPRCRSCGGCCG